MNRYGASALGPVPEFRVVETPSRARLLDRTAPYPGESSSGGTGPLEIAAACYVRLWVYPRTKVREPPLDSDDVGLLTNVRSGTAVTLRLQSYRCGVKA